MNITLSVHSVKSSLVQLVCQHSCCLAQIREANSITEAPVEGEVYSWPPGYCMWYVKAEQANK